VTGSGWGCRDKQKEYKTGYRRMKEGKYGESKCK
jgi:hypothetical protein